MRSEEGTTAGETERREPEKKAKFLRVKVVDEAKQGHPVVNVKVPIALAKWGMKMGQKYSPELKDTDIDWETLRAMVEEGEHGMLVEIEDEAEHKKVEVWVE